MKTVTRVRGQAEGEETVSTSLDTYYSPGMAIKEDLGSLCLGAGCTLRRQGGGQANLYPVTAQGRLGSGLESGSVILGLLRWN